MEKNYSLRHCNRIITNTAENNLNNEFVVESSLNASEPEMVGIQGNEPVASVFSEKVADRSLFEDFEEIERSTDDETDAEHFQNSIKTKILEISLIKWITRHNISVNQVNDLLIVLREFGISLPKTKSTLFDRNLNKSNSFAPKKVACGEYIHFGIANSINRYEISFLSTLSEICCDFNIDGLPLYKS